MFNSYLTARATTADLSVTDAKMFPVPAHFNTSAFTVSSGSRKRKAGGQGGGGKKPDDKAWLERNDRDTRWHCKRPHCNSQPDRKESYERHKIEGNKTTRYWCRDCPRTFCSCKALTSHRIHSRRCDGSGYDDAHLTGILNDGLRLNPPRKDLPPVNVDGQYYVDDNGDVDAQSTATAATNNQTAFPAQTSIERQSQYNVCYDFSDFGLASTGPTDGTTYLTYGPVSKSYPTNASGFQGLQEPDFVSAGRNDHMLPGPISRISGRLMPRDPICPRCGDCSSVTETECET